MVEETAPRRRQAFSDENLYLEPILAPLLRRVSTEFRRQWRVFQYTWPLAVEGQCEPGWL